MAHQPAGMNEELAAATLAATKRFTGAQVTAVSLGAYTLLLPGFAQRAASVYSPAGSASAMAAATPDAPTS
jgi:hypothetical protein